MMGNMFMDKGTDWKARALSAEARLAKMAESLEYAIKEADAWSDDARGGRVESPEMDAAREVLLSLRPNSPQAASRAELDLASTAVNNVAAKLAADLDGLIIQGLDLLFGPGNWSIASMAGRLEAIHQAVDGQKVVTYAVDGTPFLERREREPVMSPDFILTAGFDYRFLVGGELAGAAP